MDEVWVLSWRYSDGSASGILRAYDCEERGKYDLELLGEQDTMKVFSLDCVPVYRMNDETD